MFQSLLESAGDPTEDEPPAPPPGIHAQVEEQPRYSRMMAALIDQVKKAVDGKKSADRYQDFVTEVGSHQTKVLGLQQELLKKLAELGKGGQGKNYEPGHPLRL